MGMSKADECLLDIRKNTERVLEEYGSVTGQCMAPGSFTVRTYNAVFVRLEEDVGRRSWLVSSPCSPYDTARKKEMAGKLAFDNACLAFCRNSRDRQREADASFRVELATMGHSGDGMEM